MKLKILILIIIFFIIYLFFFIRKDDKYKFNKTYNFNNNIKENLKTGDLIFFHNNYFKNNYQKLVYFFRTDFIGTFYGHVGIIYRSKKNIIYVIDCIQYDTISFNKSYFLNKKLKKNGGVRIIKFDNLMKDRCNKNINFFGIKFIKNEIDTNLFLKNLMEYKNIDFQYPNIIFLLAFMDVVISKKLIKNYYYLINNDKMFCSQFISNFLQKCKIMKNVPDQNFWIHTFFEDNFNNITNFQYSDLYKFYI